MAVEISKTLESAGLSRLQRAGLAKDLALSPTLRSIVYDLKDDPTIPDAQKEKVIRAIGEKYLKDGDIIEKVESDLQNKDVANKFKQMAKTNPSLLAEKVIPSYTEGGLARSLAATAAPAAAPAAAKPAAVATELPKREASRPKPSSEKIVVAQNTATVSPQRTVTDAQSPIAVAAEPAASKPTPAPSDAAQPSAATSALQNPLSSMSAEDKELFKQSFSLMAKEDDKTISRAIDKNFVKDMAPAMAAEAVDKYGVDPALAEGFAKRIKDDPALQEKIANNFKQNPDFIRQLAKSMEDTSEVPGGAKELASKKMSELMENPELLASEKYIKSTTSMMKNAGMMNGISSFLKNTFNIDTSGLMGSMSGMFQGIMQWFQDFMGAFTGGGVKDFLSQPSNSKLGMFDKLAAGIGHAFGVANNTYHSPYEKMGMGMEVIPAKDGTYFHTETKKDAEGNEVKKTVPNTIEVTTINNQTHKIIPTNGELEISQSGTGNYKIKLATDIKKDPATGVVKVSDSAEFYVNEAELKKLQDKIAEKRQEAGLTEPNQMQVAQNAPAVEQKAAVIRNTPVDKDNGAVGNTVQTYPLPAQPEITVKPLSSADQDLRTMKTAALDQSTLGLMSGPTGA